MGKAGITLPMCTVGSDLFNLWVGNSIPTLCDPPTCLLIKQRPILRLCEPGLTVFLFCPMAVGRICSTAYILERFQRSLNYAYCLGICCGCAHG